MLLIVITLQGNKVWLWGWHGFRRYALLYHPWSEVHCCLTYISKTFDTVNHKLSFDEEEYMPISIIRLVYSGQHLTFHWNETALRMVFIRMVPSPLCSFLFLLLDDQSPFFFKPSSKTILILVYKHLRKFRANVLLFLVCYFVIFFPHFP